MTNATSCLFIYLFQVQINALSEIDKKKINLKTPNISIICNIIYECKIKLIFNTYMQ